VKVLVTGGAGYIGSIVSAHLLAMGAELTVVDRLVYGGEGLLGAFGNPCFRFIPGDVRDPQLLRGALAGVSAVVHLAAVVGEAACAVDPEAAWSTNLEGTRTLLKTSVECGIERFVFISTCSNYGVAASDVLADETFPLKPLSSYAEAKVAAENLVLGIDDALCSSVLRFGTICGLSPRMRFDLLVSEMARAAALNQPIRIFAPEAWRPFLHVRDAAAAIAHVLSTPRELIRGKVFNIVGQNYQKRGLVEMALKHYPQSPIEIVERETDLRDYRVSGERARREIRFDPQHTVEEAFLETAEAVGAGVFRNAEWKGHSAVPLDASRLRRPGAESSSANEP
jgi:nucleoside-diphosphate-sugar epimerase